MSVEFNGAELRLARIFNGFALEDVAARIDKTRQYLHKLETGAAAPTEQLLIKLAEVLQVQPEFFMAGVSARIEEDQFHFRKQFTTRNAIKQTAMARGELVSRLVNYLESELKLPELRMPSMGHAQSSDDIELAAESCRREWNLGNGPVMNMSLLAENIGAIVTSFASISKEIDAMSVALQRPIIVRNEAKESACRQRFDVGHELGHCVLHAGMATGDRVTETQANRFASALLIPRTMMAKLFPRPRSSRLDWRSLSEFKLTWKMSKAAILYRARQLDLLSDAQYKSGVITLRRTGEALGEREDHLIQREAPDLLARSLTLLAERKSIYAEDLASKLRISTFMLRDVVGFEVLTRPQLPARPSLYLVN